VKGWTGGFQVQLRTSSNSAKTSNPVADLRFFNVFTTVFKP